MSEARATPKLASDLRPGDVLKTLLWDRDAKGNQVREKKVKQRTVVRVVLRDAVPPAVPLIQVHTTQKAHANAREVWELRGDMVVAT